MEDGRGDVKGDGGRGGSEDTSGEGKYEVEGSWGDRLKSAKML